MVKKVIPQLSETNLADIFVEADNSPFCKIDSNLAAWLFGTYAGTTPTAFSSFVLEEHQNNQELIDSLEGLEMVRHFYTFSPQQICFLAEQSIAEGPLLKNGFSNLFFILSAKDGQVYIVGVVWNKNIHKFVPYVYRIENLYRSWSKGNQVFTRK